jgi:carbon-monoxide dehydrogenase medium subunit
VKPAPFKYAKAETVAEATALLDQHADDVKVLAGGQSLIPLMNMRLARPEVLIDITGIDELSGIEVNGALTIGATTRHVEVLRSNEVRAFAPIIAAAMRHVGHVGVRTRGTFGGSVAHADPASEIPAIVIALDGELTVAGPSSERTVAAADYFVSTFTTDMEENEILTAVRFPYPLDRARWSFHEVARRHGDFALVGVAAVAEVDEAGVCTRARIALSGVSDVPVRATAAEELVVGSTIGEVAAEAGRLAERQIDPGSDFHASAEYRKEVARALVTRALNDMATKGEAR